MMKNKILTLLMILTTGLVGIASATGTICEYDAGPDGGGPADLDPVLQGWTGTHNTLDTSVFSLQPDAATGYNGWQINDQSSSLNPRYQYDLTAADFQKMYDRGWVFEFRVRPVQGGNFVMWGITTANDPGWGLTARERVGFGVSYVEANNALSVSPIGGSAVELAVDSAGSYHLITAVGAPKSSVVDLYIDGVWNQQYDIKSGTSNSGSDNRVGFQSGSTGGTGKVANWNLVSLRYGNVTVSQTDGDTSVAEGLGSDTYDVVLWPDPNYPASPVTVTITPDSQVDVDTTSIVFPADTGDPNDYTVTVTVTAVDDADVEFPIHMGIISHSVSAAEEKWNEGDFADLVVNVADDDGTPGVTVSTGTLILSEDGTTDTYTIVLDTPPTSPVTIGFAPDAQLADVNDIIFDDTNWATPQVITLVAIDDLDAEDTPHLGVMSHTITTADGDYSLLTVPDVTAGILDNDTTGPTSVEAFAWFKADAGAMNGNAPAADGEDVTLWIDQTGNGRDVYRLSGGHNRPTYIADGGYTGQPTLEFGINDHIWASRSEFHNPLDGADPFPHTVFVVTTVASLGDYQVLESTSSNGNFELGTSGSGNWEMNTDQAMLTDDAAPIGSRVVLTAVYNGGSGDSELYQNGQLIHSAPLPSGDAGMSGLMVGSFSDDFDGEIAEIVWYKGSLTALDRAEVENYLIGKYLGKIAVYETGGSTTVTEGGAADTYQIEVLGSPTAQVDITVTPTGPNASEIDLGAGMGTPITLNFPTAGIQTVTVTADDNATSDGPRDVTITHTVSTTDTNYDVTVSDVIVTVEDDEAWCGQPGTVYHAADLNKDCYVTLEDFALLAKEWLECTDPGNLACEQLPVE